MGTTETHLSVSIKKFTYIFNPSDFSRFFYSQRNPVIAQKEIDQQLLGLNFSEIINE